MIVFYHANCADGITSAWLVKRWNQDAVLVPCAYGDREWTKHDVHNQDVMFVDFSESREDLELIRGLAKSLVVLDHHKTAQKALEGFPGAIFDMNKAGCQIVWDYLYPYQKDQYPPIVTYVADRDLWKWLAINSKEINAYLSLFEHTTEAWDALHDDMTNDLSQCRLYGEVLLKKQAKDALKQARDMDDRVDEAGNLYGYGNVASNISETGDTYLNVVQPKAAYSLTYFDLPKEGKRVFSLRSRKGFDVSVIAKSRGGGGHPAAAGYTEKL